MPLPNYGTSLKPSIGGRALLLFALALSVPFANAQSSWTVIGPDGGDARSIAAVPGESKHLYLGTTNSWIYESTDQGASWHRLAKLDKADDLVVDHILVDARDPSLIYAAAWKLDRPDGGLWISHDRGKIWTANPGLQGLRRLRPMPAS
jgi:hypothetical protein